MTFPESRPPLTSPGGGPLPGFCGRCGKAQIIRFRLGDETLVGNCCIGEGFRSFDEARGEALVHRLVGCPLNPCPYCAAVWR